MRVLVVEDDYASRVFLQSLLNRYGTTATAENGSEAVTMFEEAIEAGTPYDLVCLDVMMPVMDGHKALKRFREIEKARGVPAAEEARVIMITALRDPNAVVRAYYKGGAVAYLTKPVDVENMLSVLRELNLIE